MGEKQILNMDYSATTHSKKEVVDAMIPYYAGHFGNPSSVYSITFTKRSTITARKQGLEPWGEKNPHSHEHSEDLTCNQQAAPYALIHKHR